MSKMAKLVLLLMVLLLSLALVGRGAERGDAKEIVKKMDELYRSQSSYAAMEMEIATPHWKRTLKMEAWSLGMEKFFLRILEPKKERGIATLKIGNEMWNFLPRTNKVMKVPPSMMMGSWMGSDFTNDDLVKEYTFFDDYSFEFTQVENPQPDVLYVKCIPREGLPIVWGYIVVAVRDQDYLPVWQGYYDEKEQLMREMVFKDIKTLGGKKIPAVMELVPLNKKGNKTIVRYLDARFDIKIDKDTFTLRNLRKGI